MTLSVLFSCFVNQDLVLKQLAELKEDHLRTSERSSYPLVTHSTLGWVLSCFFGGGGHEARLGPSQVWDGPQI